MLRVNFFYLKSKRQDSPIQISIDCLQEKSFLEPKIERIGKLFERFMLALKTKVNQVKLLKIKIILMTEFDLKINLFV